MDPEELIKYNLSEAKRFLKNADHMLNVTYPLIKDGKFLLGCSENLFLSATLSIEALLTIERLFKRVPPFHKTFESKYRVFMEFCYRRYGFKKEEIEVIDDLKDILLNHKKSPIEFSKTNKYIIWDDEYNPTSLNFVKVKYYYKVTNIFVEKISRLVNNYDELFRIHGRSFK